LSRPASRDLTAIDVVDVEIESLDLNGDGLARLGRRRLTVPFTIPGERVRVRLATTRAGFTSASVVEILRASRDRVNPRCRHFGAGADGGRSCGGCSWQHIAYPAQLALKTEVVTRLVRAAVPSAPAARGMLAATPHDSPWHYRNKVHFVVERGQAGTFVMGHFARFSRRVVAIDECPVHDERGNSVAFSLRDACRAADARDVRSIAVRSGVARSETMATLVVASDRDRRARVASRRALAGPAAPTSLHVNVHPRGDAFIFGKETRHVAGPERLREDVGGASFLISPTSFFQTNVRAAELLVQQVVASVPAGAVVLDLYAGAGLFAIPLAQRGHMVVAVEENRAAVADGEASRRLSRVPDGRCRFVAKPVEAALGSRSGSLTDDVNVVILDPPREGCRPLTIDRLLDRGGPPGIIYVSCDPESLARDLHRITTRGYVIDSMQPVDMFPHTPHIETVVVLSRKKDRP
jgi:23S rRNA (uracil1939-C5)-methyltransferase